MADQTTDQLPASGALPAVQGKPVAAPKGYGYGLPVPAGGVPVPSSILDELEKIYQRRVASQNPFQEWMKDIAAWGAPGEGLAKRQQEKSAREQELFRMRADIASGRAAQQQLALQSQKLQGLVGPNAAPGQIPAYVAVGIREKLDNNDIAGAQKILDDYRKGVTTEEVKFTTNPASYQNNITVMLPDGRLQEVNAIEARSMFESGRARPVTPAAPAPAAPAPAAPAPAAPAPKVSAVEPGIAAPDMRPVSSTTLPFSFESLSQDQRDALEQQMEGMGIRSRGVFSRPDMADRFNAYPEEARRKLFAAADQALATRTGAIPVSAPAAPQAPAAPEAIQVAQAPARLPTIPEAKARQKFEEQRGAELAKIEAEDQKAHMDANRNAIDRERTASETIKLLYEDPTITGFFQKPGVASALGTLIKTGISAPGGHSIGIKELDDVLFKGQKTVTPEQIAARDRLRTLLNKASLFLTPVYNKGQGAVTDYERTLYANLVGSLDNTPENIVKIQKALLENAKMRRKIDAAWKDSKMAWGDFTKSPQYSQLERDYDKVLEGIENEKVTFGVPKGKVEIKPFDKDKEAEYQRWAAEQRKKQRK